MNKYLLLLPLLGAGQLVAAEVRRPETPNDNPTTTEKVIAGNMIFHDPRVSALNRQRQRTIACITCHNPALGFSDKGPVSVGIDGKTGTRRAPTLINVGLQPQGVKGMFWDGREIGLEGQASQPMQAQVEMGNQTLAQISRRLDAIPGYHAQFLKAFGTGVNETTLVQAVSAFERTLISTDAPVDRYEAGDVKALTKSQALGYLVLQKNCRACHSGPDYTDRKFHNIGVVAQFGANRAGQLDQGRFVVTKDPADKFAFKTPTLREVQLHPPYFHAGQAADLAAVVNFLNNPPQTADTDPLIKPLHLSAEEQQGLLDLLTGGFHGRNYPEIDTPALP